MTFQMGLSLELITTLFTLDELCLIHILNNSKLVLLPQWYSFSCLFKLFSFKNVLLHSLQAWWTTYLSVLWMYLCFAKWLEEDEDVDEEEDWNPHKSKATFNSMLKSGSTSCRNFLLNIWVLCSWVPAMTRPQPFRLTFYDIYLN